MLIHVNVSQRKKARSLQGDWDKDSHRKDERTIHVEAHTSMYRETDLFDMSLYQQCATGAYNGTQIRLCDKVARVTYHHRQTICLSL